jgi:hypothetical protein
VEVAGHGRRDFEPTFAVNFRLHQVADSGQEMTGHRYDVRCVIELADQHLEIVPRAGGFRDDAYYGVVPGLLFVVGQGY